MNTSINTQARLKRLAFCFIIGAGSVEVLAQPAVVDFEVEEMPVSQNQMNSTSSAAIELNSTATNNVVVKPKTTQQMNGELFYQLQLLQEDVMTLRGLLEEQSSELQRLKQQRLDDYLMTDRRMSLLEQAAVTDSIPATTTLQTTANSAAVSAPVVSQVVADGADQNAYKAAYELIKTRQLEEAEKAFEQFIIDYQQSEYLANAYYWLGELYDRKGKMDKAKAAFLQVLERFPDSNKVPDALYKLGKVYHQLGDNLKAQEYLNAVIARFGNTSRTSVRQAKEYLEKNFSGNG